MVGNGTIFPGKMHFFRPGTILKKDEAVLEPQVLPAFAITYFWNHCNIRFDPIPEGDMCKSTQEALCPSPMKIHYWPFFKNFSQKVNNTKWPSDDLWPHMLMSHVRLYPRIIVPNSHGNTWKYVDTVTIYQTLNQKVNDPKMAFNPTSVKITCATLPNDCIQPWSL